MASKGQRVCDREQCHARYGQSTEACYRCGEKSAGAADMQKSNRMCHAFALGIVLTAALPAAALAAEPNPNEVKLAQMEALQFGEYFGGAASMYDICVNKGLLPKGATSAEEQAEAYIAAPENERFKDSSKFVHQGWRVARTRMDTDIGPNYYDATHCKLLAEQWEKYRAMLKLP
jgi:hypothetical protein